MHLAAAVAAAQCDGRTYVSVRALHLSMPLRDVFMATVGEGHCPRRGNRIWHGRPLRHHQSREPVQTSLRTRRQCPRAQGKPDQGHETLHGSNKSACSRRAPAALLHAVRLAAPRRAARGTTPVALARRNVRDNQDNVRKDRVPRQTAETFVQTVMRERLTQVEVVELITARCVVSVRRRPPALVPFSWARE
jgi:hypothetical protein